MSELSVGQLRGLTVNNNVVSVPSGHTLYAPGHVIQVINVEDRGRSSQGLPVNTFINVGSLEARITPKSASSKIIIQARWFGELSAQDVTYNSMWGVSRNGTQIGGQPDPSGTVISGVTTTALSYWLNDAASTPESMSLFISDTPGTTSEIIYRVTFIASGGGTIFNNRVAAWTGQVSGYELGTSSLMLMEVAQ
jgi:hypothetical protein